MSHAKDTTETHWLADAASMDTSRFDLAKYITITSRIEEFINQNKFIVAAPKGYGKTLLLKYTRLKNRERYEDEDHLTIPTNIEIDSFDHPFEYDGNFRTYLESQETWEKIWQISIGLSLIINYAIKLKNTELLTDFLENFRKNNKLSELVGVTEKVSQKLKKKLPISAQAKIQANPTSFFKYHSVYKQAGSCDNCGASVKDQYFNCNDCLTHDG